MALSKDEIKGAYPLPAYNYRVTILPGLMSSIPGGGALAGAMGMGTVISCTEVSGLAMELETVTYKHGMSFLMGTHIMPGQIKEVNLTIKKGVTTNGGYFKDWLKLVYPIVIPILSRLTRRRNMLIDLCDEGGNPVVRWKVVKAMPIKIEAPTFDATTNEVAFQSMQFIASRMSIEYLND